MVKIVTDEGEIVVPLIFNDPDITAQMQKWRAIVEKHYGKSDHELVGLKVGPNDEWVGVFRKKP